MPDSGLGLESRFEYVMYSTAQYLRIESADAIIRGRLTSERDEGCSMQNRRTSMEPGRWEAGRRVVSSPGRKKRTSQEFFAAGPADGSTFRLALRTHRL